MHETVASADVALEAEALAGACDQGLATTVEGDRDQAFLIGDEGLTEMPCLLFRIGELLQELRLFGIHREEPPRCEGPDFSSRDRLLGLLIEDLQLVQAPHLWIGGKGLQVDAVLRNQRLRGTAIQDAGFQCGSTFRVSL